MKGIVFLQNYYNAISKLPREMRLDVYETILGYAFDGIQRDVQTPTKDACDIFYVFAKAEIKVFEYGDGPYRSNWDGVPEERKMSDRNSAGYRNFRKAVLERDGYTCRNCGTKKGTMNVHHIRPYAKHPDLRLDINNGITLCTKCHRKAHKNEKR